MGMPPNQEAMGTLADQGGCLLPLGHTLSGYSPFHRKTPSRGVPGPIPCITRAASLLNSYDFICLRKSLLHIPMLLHVQGIPDCNGSHRDINSGVCERRLLTQPSLHRERKARSSHSTSIISGLHPQYLSGYLRRSWADLFSLE